MEVSGWLDQVLFVIVLHKQRLGSSKAFESLKPLMQKYPARVSLFAYDNSSEPTNDRAGANHYIHDPKNPGVSRAYNKAFEYAKEKKLRFLMLMDQDSFIPEHVFDSYSQAVVRHPEIQVFAPHANDDGKMYSPFRLAKGRGVATPELKAGVHALRDIKFINSGLLISTHAFEKCGGYDERFPLDFSDIVFCDRLYANDFSICLIDDAIFHHHSSSQSGDKNRFEHYLRALALYKSISSTNISYWWGGLPRAAKLSVQTRDRWFLQRFFSLRT